MKEIKRALISVFYKDGLTEVVQELNKLGVEILSTGGTYDFIGKLNIPVKKVEDLTTYPSILGGRVKTLHPKVFGGILNRRDNEQDKLDIKKYEIPNIDLVIVDLYPFEQYIKEGASDVEIIEKIDIGGISLIRAAAKNFNDVVIIPSKENYPMLLDLLKTQNGTTSLAQREYFAAQAFLTSSHYDTAIFNYFNIKHNIPVFTVNLNQVHHLRYGENPHQKGVFFADKESLPKQLHGKEISYNNMLDIEAAIELISDFAEPTVAIIKHNNACGCASSKSILDAWGKALTADPVSAFGGIIIANKEIDTDSAEEINKIFFEIILAPSYTQQALDILKCKKNRIILEIGNISIPNTKFRSLLGGVLKQDRDSYTESALDLNVVTNLAPTDNELDDLLFANKLVKHSKSNAIVLVKDKQLLASGIGQTSRVDALKQAITKAHTFKFNLDGAVMSSDAFFPFADCVEIAADQGIRAVIQPGGSIRDCDSIDFCNKNNIAMIITGIRHFKH